MEYKGFTYTPIPKTAWDNLSMLEKSEMMKVAIKNGITDLKTIKEQYNEFAEGGYLDWKEKASKYKHLDIDNDRTYDYEGWYNENPQRAWDFLNDSPDAHFDDKYKTVYHPTFSTQSKYSGKKDATYNPQGLTGGTWNKQGTVFTMSPDGYRGPVSMDERKWYLENAEDNGVQLREADGSLPVFDGIPWGGVLPNVTVIGNRFAEGGGIHIKDSKKGTFTAAAKKHGKSVQAFASQVLAHPENYSLAMRRKANFARNASKWHGEGGPLQGPIVDMAMANIYEDGGDVTPEGKVFQDFVVKASEDPMVILAKQNPEYRQTLSDMYDTFLTRPQATRLLNVYNEAGKPKLRPLPEDRNRAFTRDNIFMSKPVMYLSSDGKNPNAGFDDLIAELAHPIQSKYGNNKSWKERLNPFYHEDDYRGKTRYDFPNKYESETHEDFEPLLYSYVLNNWLPSQGFLTSMYEGEKEIGDNNNVFNPEFPKQVMDSARVYNRRKQDMNYQYKNPRSERIKRNKLFSFFGDLF